MSIGGAFYALDRYRLRALVIDPSTVSGFLHSPAAQGGPHDSQTVEQAWDVVRTLLPEAVDGRPRDAWRAVLPLRWVEVVVGHFVAAVAA